MLKLKSLLQKLSRTKVTSYCRRFSTEIQQEEETLSSRQKTWLTSQKRYQNYDNILYSSYLEMQEENMSYGLKRALVSKVRRDMRRQQIQEKQWGKTVPDVPEDWMEEYEFYTTPEGGESCGNKLGTADPLARSSNVPCNGCGAVLHCNHHTRPGKSRRLYK